MTIQHKIFIGIPSRERSSYPVAGPLAEVLLRLQSHSDHEVEIAFHAGQPVELARNNLVEKFLQSECDFLLMIDDDIIPPDDILDMAHHDKDVVGALCYACNLDRGIFPVAYLKSEHGHYRGGYDIIARGTKAENTGLVQVGLVGSGCIMIHRRVFEGLNRPYFMFKYNPEATTIEESEDFWFCAKAIEARFEVYVDTDKICGHLKTFDLREMLHMMERVSEEESMRKVRKLAAALLDES